MEKDLEMAAMAISKLSSIEDEMYEHLKECYPNQRPELEDAYWGIVKVRENLQHFITENTPNGLERILGQV